MDPLIALLVVAIVFTCIGMVLPTWWLTALPSVLFVGLFLVAFATGSMDGEGGWAMGIAFTLAVPFVAVATGCVALGVTIGKAIYRALRKAASGGPPGPPQRDVAFAAPPYPAAVEAPPRVQAPVAPERPFGA